MKIEVSINLLKDIFGDFESCNHCKYKGTDCTGKSCSNSKIETLIEKSKLILDLDSAILELEKEKRKCNDKQTDWLIFAIAKLENIKSDYLFMK